MIWNPLSAFSLQDKKMENGHLLQIIHLWSDWCATNCFRKLWTFPHLCGQRLLAGWWPWHEWPLYKILKDWEQSDQLWWPLNRSAKPQKLHKFTKLLCHFISSTSWLRFPKLEFRAISFQSRMKEMGVFRKKEKFNSCPFDKPPSAPLPSVWFLDVIASQ